MGDRALLRRIVQGFVTTFGSTKGRAIEEAQAFIDRLASLDQRISLYTFDEHGMSRVVMALSTAAAEETIKSSRKGESATYLASFEEHFRLVKTDVVTAAWLAANCGQPFFKKSLENIEGDLSARESLDAETITISSVESLCKAVGIVHHPIKETVYFGRGGGHQPVTNNGVGTFYIDLDLLEGDGKEQRMQNALEILAKDLGSNEALKALSQNSILRLGSETLRRPKQHLTTDHGSGSDRGR